MTKKRNKNRLGGMEQLQSRELMAGDLVGAAGSTIEISEPVGSILEINGTNLHDEVTVNHNEGAGVMSVTAVTRDSWGRVVDSQYRSFEADKVFIVEFDAHNGNDKFTNNSEKWSRADGGSGVDVLFGGEGRDFFDGGAGSDRIYGRGGMDEIFGGLGNDRLFGQAGVDTIYGDNFHESNLDGADRIYGGSSNDTLRGGGGRDIISGGSQNDWISGGSGNDSLHGNDGHDIMYGNSGTDYLYGGRGNDWMDGGLGAVDQLWGNQDNDTFIRHKRAFGSNDKDVFNDKTSNDKVENRWHW